MLGWQRAPRTGNAYLYGRKVVIAVVGTTVAALGLAMLLLPGPGIIVVLLGLAILGAEFAWAQSLLRSVRNESSRTAARARARSRLRRLRSRGPRPRPTS